MIIVYCETCGVRVSEEAVHSGQAAVAGPNKYYCDKCAPASNPAQNRKSPGGSNRLAALMQKAAAAQPAGSNTRARAAKEKPSDPAWMYIAGGVVLIAGAVYFFIAARPQNAAAKNLKPATKTESVAPASANSTKPPVPATKSPDPKAEPKTALRVQESDPDLEKLRHQRGLKLLDEARAWAKANPDDPWGYKDRLTMIANIYRSTPAAEEAAKILITLKMPDGPRPTGTAAPVEIMPNPFAPSAPEEGWQPIFDGKTIPFRPNTAETWRIEGGALVAQGRVHPQTLFTFSDGTVRLRLVLQEASYCEILVRQSTHGYGVSMDRRVLEPLWGKPMELIFYCKGPEVTATLNGQPVEVKSGNRPEKGHIQINNVNGTTRVFGLDYRAGK